MKLFSPEFVEECRQNLANALQVVLIFTLFVLDHLEEPTLDFN